MTDCNNPITQSELELIMLDSGYLDMHHTKRDLIEVLVKRAGVEISVSKMEMERGTPPTPENIDDMSELASDLIEFGYTIVAGRVDKALVDWCGLLLDA